MVTVGELLAWMDANESKPYGLGPNPASDEQDILQRCIDAAVTMLEAAYDLPENPGEDIRLAVLIQATRLLKRRQTPEGVFSLGDFGTIRMSGYDPDVLALLAPYRAWRFS